MKKLRFTVALPRGRTGFRHKPCGKLPRAADLWGQAINKEVGQVIRAVPLGPCLHQPHHLSRLPAPPSAHSCASKTKWSLAEWKTGEVLKVTGSLRNREEDREDESWKYPYSFSFSPSPSSPSVFRHCRRDENCLAGHRKQSHEHPPPKQGNELGFGILNNSGRMVPEQPLLNLFKFFFPHASFAYIVEKSWISHTYSISLRLIGWFCPEMD